MDQFDNSKKSSPRGQIISTFLPGFSFFCRSVEVATWGDEDYGGDSSEVQEELKQVQQISATKSAFAAVLLDAWKENKCKDQMMNRFVDFVGYARNNI